MSLISHNWKVIRLEMNNDNLLLSSVNICIMYLQMLSFGLWLEIQELLLTTQCSLYLHVNNCAKTFGSYWLLVNNNNTVTFKTSVLKTAMHYGLLVHQLLPL